MSLRNVGAGIAVLQGWNPESERRFAQDPFVTPDAFRPQGRDLYVPPGDVGFWQAAIREPSDLAYAPLLAAIQDRQMFTVELLYTDHEGGQRTISRFALTPGEEGSQWLCSVSRHWNLDRPNPR